MTHKKIVMASTTGALMLTSLLAFEASAGTGYCIYDPAFNSKYELNLPACSGNDCLVQLDRPFYPSLPIPSSGALKIDGSTWYINWNGSFEGATQGTVHYSCVLDLSSGLPATGEGMGQRIANFSSPAVEFFTGTCTLALCSDPAPSSLLGSAEAGWDPTTEQSP